MNKRKMNKCFTDATFCCICYFPCAIVYDLCHSSIKYVSTKTTFQRGSVASTMKDLSPFYKLIHFPFYLIDHLHF